MFQTTYRCTRSYRLNGVPQNKKCGRPNVPHHSMWAYLEIVFKEALDEIIRVDPNPLRLCKRVIKRGHLDRDRDTQRKDDVKTRTVENAMWRWRQRWVMLLEPGTPKTIRKPQTGGQRLGTGSPSDPSEGNNPADTLIVDLQPPNWDSLCLPSKSVALCYGSLQTPKHQVGHFGRYSPRISG